MSNKFITGRSSFVSLELENIKIPTRNTVANVIISLDYINGYDPSEFKPIPPIVNFIEQFLGNYSNPDFFEIINSHLTFGLLSDPDLKLSSVLDSLSITLDVAPTDTIPFPFAHTITCTPSGDSNGLVFFKLEDIWMPAHDTIADIIVSLDYVDKLSQSKIKPVQSIVDFIKDYLLTYPKPDSLEDINGNLTFGLLSYPDLGLASVFDSLSVTLGVSRGRFIPFPCTNTITATANQVAQLSRLADELLFSGCMRLANSFPNIDTENLKQFW